MALFFMLTSYLATVLGLVTGAFMGLAVLTSPVESQPSKSNQPNLVTKADPAKHILVEPRRSGQVFRYGPDVNLGRSDTPVYAAQQALKQARAAAPAKRQQRYQERVALNPIAIGFAPAQSSGAPRVR
jgi:hypothetical protein